MIVELSLPLLMVFCLVLTIIIEILIAWLVFKIKGRELAGVVLVNVMTNPIVVSFSTLVDYEFGRPIYFVGLALLEFFAFWSEGMVYKKFYHYRRPFLMSFVLNLSSFLFGIILGFIVTFVIV